MPPCIKLPNPTNNPKLPTSVQKNISVTASPIRSDFAVACKRYREVSSNNSKETKAISKLTVWIKINPAARRQKRVLRLGRRAAVGLRSNWLRKTTKGKTLESNTARCQTAVSPNKVTTETLTGLKPGKLAIPALATEPTRLTTPKRIKTRTARISTIAALERRVLVRGITTKPAKSPKPSNTPCNPIKAQQEETKAKHL
jgi:hypothetical protein